MNNRITKKLDHEKGKLRDKAKNPDYHERLREEGDNFERGGTHGNKIVMVDALNPGAILRKSIIQDKDTAFDVLASKLRSLPLKVGGYNFSFKYNDSSFAKVNDIPFQQAQKLLPQLRAEAEELF